MLELFNPAQMYYRRCGPTRLKLIGARSAVEIQNDFRLGHCYLDTIIFTIFCYRELAFLAID